MLVHQCPHSLFLDNTFYQIHPAFIAFLLVVNYDTFAFRWDDKITGKCNGALVIKENLAESIQYHLTLIKMTGRDARSSMSTLFVH